MSVVAEVRAGQEGAKKCSESLVERLYILCILFSIFTFIYLAGSVVALRHVGSYFPNQGLSPHPLHWKADSSPLDHQGSPYILYILT